MYISIINQNMVLNTCVLAKREVHKLLKNSTSTTALLRIVWSIAYILSAIHPKGEYFATVISLDFRNRNNAYLVTLLLCNKNQN